LYTQVDLLIGLSFKKEIQNQRFHELLITYNNMHLFITRDLFFDKKKCRILLMTYLRRLNKNIKCFYL